MNLQPIWVSKNDFSYKSNVKFFLRVLHLKMSYFLLQTIFLLHKNKEPDKKAEIQTISGWT